MRKLCAVLLVAIFLVCSGCGNVKVALPQDVLLLAEEISKERAGAYADSWDAEDEVLFRSYCMPADDTGMDWEALRVKSEDPPAYLSYEEAREDIRTLFDALKSAYSGYDYFGGDEVFEAIEADICQEVLLGLKEDGTIRRKNLAQILREKLSEAIQDGHFRIGQERLNAGDIRMYYVPGVVFESPNAVSGVPAELVRPTISPEGTLAYGLFAQSQTGDELPTSATVNGAAVSLNWVGEELAGFSDSICSISKKQGITVLGLRSFSPSNGREERALDDFVASGERYQGENVLIIDLRDNGGGNSCYPSNWLANYLGIQAMPKRMWAMRYTGFWMASAEQSIANQEDVENAREKLGTSFVTCTARIIRENRAVIFVLVDRHTASAAEGFLWELRSVENTVVVGSNTAGCVGFGNIGVIYLPHSGTQVQFGSSFSFTERLESAEDRGISPDLWVPSGDALDAVLALCKSGQA